MTSHIRLILVPTDFSAHADRAVDYAQGLAERMGAALHLLHVIEEPSLPASWSGEFYTSDISTLQAELVSDAEQRIEATRRTLEARGVSVGTSVVVGHAAQSIADRAADLGADLVVVGTHGRSGLAHLLMGSVAERVMRIAPCPVLVVRQVPVAEPEATPVAATTGAS